jgi:hypothetical protein
MPKIKHIVMFGLKEDLTDEKLEGVKAGLLALPDKIPQILDCQLGVDLLLPAGQSHPAGNNRSISWMAEFASARDYQRYETHPAHVALIENVLKPAMVPGTRAAIQYEVRTIQYDVRSSCQMNQPMDSHAPVRTK